MYQGDHNHGFHRHLNSSSGQQGCSKFPQKGRVSESHTSFCNCGLVHISCNETSHEIKLVVEGSNALKPICFVTVNGEVFTKPQTPTSWIYDNNNLDLQLQAMEIEKKKGKRRNISHGQAQNQQHTSQVHRNDHHSGTSFSEPRQGFKPKPPKTESRLVVYQVQPTAFELNKADQRRQKEEEEELKNVLYEAPSVVPKILQLPHWSRSSSPSFDQSPQKQEQSSFGSSRYKGPRQDSFVQPQSYFGEQRFGEKESENARHQKKSMTFGPSFSQNRLRPHIRPAQPVKHDEGTSSDEWHSEVKTVKPKANGYNSDW